MELAETNTYMLTFNHGSTIYNVIGSTQHVISPGNPLKMHIYMIPPQHV